VLVLRFREARPGIELPAALIITTIAITVGTTVRISGVLLSIPAIASVIVLIWRSKRKIADLALFVMGTAVATALGYVIAALMDPDTGSYNDQAAIALGVVGALVGIVAIVRSVVEGRPDD
jgi:hypothetical protein